MRHIVKYFFLISLTSAVLRPLPPIVSKLSIETRFYTEKTQINAAKVSKEEFDSVVSIQTLRGDNLCTGVLIDVDFVLTSAACLEISNGRFHKTLQVQGDSVTLLHAKTRKTKNIFIHNAFDSGSLANNLAILEIESFDNRDLGDVITPLITPDNTDDSCVVYGWAVDEEQHTLGVFNISVNLTDDCESHFGEINKGICVTGRNSCLNGVGNILFCSGHLTGVLSFGYGCGRIETPNVYTDLSEYNQWIDDVLKGAIYNNWGDDPVYIRTNFEKSNKFETDCSMDKKKTISDIFCEEYNRNCVLQKSDTICSRGIYPYSCKYAAKMPNLIAENEEFLKIWFTFYYFQVKVFLDFQQKQLETFRQFQMNYFPNLLGNLPQQDTKMNCEFNEKFNEMAKIAQLEPFLDEENCNKKCTE